MTKVLVVGLFNNLAGTEAVVTNYIRLISRSISFDILVHDHMSNYDEIVSQPNVNEIIIPLKRKDYLGYRRSLNRVIKRGGYDAIWHNAGNITNIDALKLACRYNIPTRIFHAHNSVFDGNVRDKIISTFHKRILKKYITDCWACSHTAGRFFFGEQYQIVNNAIDEEKYSFSEVNRNLSRNELGIAEKQKVIGTIGRLTYQKNHEWLIKLFATFFSDGDYILLIIGSGELGKKLEEIVSGLGMRNRIMFLGRKSNVEKYLSAMDLFVLPSLYEGLPVVLSEAQANGLPCIVSSNVSKESSYIHQNRFIPLEEEETWVEAIRNTDRKLITVDEEIKQSYDIVHEAYRLSSWWTSRSKDNK